MLRLAYGDDFEGYVIPAGRNPIYFNPFVTKEESVLAIGRLWDTGKQVALLTQHKHGLPVCIVGADNPIPTPHGADPRRRARLHRRARDFGEGSADRIATALALQQVDNFCRDFVLRAYGNGVDRGGVLALRAGGQ